MSGQGHASTTLTSGFTRHLLYRGLGGPQGQSERVRKISHPPGFDLWTVQPVVSRYTDWVIPAHYKPSKYKIIAVIKNLILSLTSTSIPAVGSSRGVSQMLSRDHFSGSKTVFSSAADGLLRMQHLLARGGAHTNTEPRYIQPCCTHFNFTLLSNKPIYSLVIAFWEINYCWVLYNWKWKRNRAWSGVLPLLFARGNKKFSGLKLSMQYVLVLLANMAWEAR